MKKVLFGMALTIAAVTVNAQQLTNAEGKTPAAANLSREGAANEQATNLQTRVTRILALDPATSAKIGEATAEYYQKLNGKSTAAEAATLKNAREAKFQSILGEEKYAHLNEYRAKLQANIDNPQVMGRGAVDKVLLD